MEIVLQHHAQTALPPELCGEEARMMRMDFTPPQIITRFARISIKVKEFENLIMESVSQVHAPTALPPVLFE
jgi:hypothetical protein